MSPVALFFSLATVIVAVKAATVHDDSGMTLAVFEAVISALAQFFYIKKWTTI